MVSQKDKFHLSDEEITEKETSKLLDDYDFEGLVEVVDEFRNMKKEGLHEKLYEVYLQDIGIYNDFVELTSEDRRDEDLLTLSFQNLSRPSFFALRRDLITFVDFSGIFTTLIRIYYLYLGRNIEHDDLKKLYTSKIDERLVFGLDKFDEIQEVPEPKAEFFQKIKKLKWLDKETKKFFEKLHEIKIYASFGHHISNFKLIDFKVRERQFLLALAGCSAVNSDRNRINMEDVVIAYKAYFKLIKTNIPELIDSLGDLNYKES